MKKFIEKYSGIIIFMGLSIAFVLLLDYITPEPKDPPQVIPHNNWKTTPKDSL